MLITSGMTNVSVEFPRRDATQPQAVPLRPATRSRMLVKAVTAALALPHRTHGHYHSTSAKMTRHVQLKFNLSLAASGMAHGIVDGFFENQKKLAAQS